MATVNNPIEYISINLLSRWFTWFCACLSIKIRDYDSEYQIINKIVEINHLFDDLSLGEFVYGADLIHKNQSFYAQKEHVHNTHKQIDNTSRLLN